MTSWCDITARVFHLISLFSYIRNIIGPFIWSAEQSFSEHMKNGDKRCQPWNRDTVGKLGLIEDLIHFKLLVSCSAPGTYVTPLETTSVNAWDGVQIIEIIFHNIL